MKHTIQVNGQVQVVDFDLVQIDPNLLGQAMQTQAAMYSYWAAVAAKLTRAVGEVKLKLKTLRAQVGEALRSGRIPMQGKITEAAYKERIDADPRIVALAKKLLETEESLAVVQALLDGLRQRKDMLYMLGLFRNTEARVLK